MLKFLLIDAGLIEVDKEERIHGAAEKPSWLAHSPYNERSNQDI
jgi:hypothetical protein